MASSSLRPSGLCRPSVVAIRGQPGVARHIRMEHRRQAFRDWLWEGAGRPGLRIDCEHGMARVLAVQAGGAAERAGVQVGDFIVRVGSREVARGIDAVLLLLDRRPAAELELRVARGATEETLVLRR